MTSDLPEREDAPRRTRMRYALLWAGYAALAPLFGLAPETGLAISLLRRARDITVAVPVLLIWQLVEARRAARMGQMP